MPDRPDSADHGTSPGSKAGNSICFHGPSVVKNAVLW